MIADTLFGPEITVIIILIGVAAIIAHGVRAAAPLVFLGTGVVVGPVLGLVDGGSSAELLADLGLVFLLFLIGLDLKAERIRPTLWTTLKIAPAQMLVTLTVFTGITWLFFDPVTATIIGVAAAYSSTAVVLQMLAERGEVGTTAGRLDTGLLLFEDMTVIVVIAAITAGTAATGLGGAVLQTMAALAVVGGIAYVCSRYVFPKILPASYDRPHAYFLQAIGVLFLFIGIADATGVSHEIGAFFAGIALAQLPGNDEIHERVRPLTELFMALFFISLSIGMTASELLAHWELAVVLSVIVLAEKFVVHYGLFRLAGYDGDVSFHGSINMTQTSEFSLVLGATAVGAGLIGAPVLGLLTLVALLTMMVSTVLIDQQDRLYGLIGDVEHPEHRESGVVVAGFGEAGPDVLAVLEQRFDDIVVVDPRPGTARALRDTDHEHIFADIRHEEIKHRSGFYTADIVIGLDVSPETGADMLEARTDGTIMVTADTDSAQAFRDDGAAVVIDREDIGSDHFQQIISQTIGGERDG